MSDLTSERTVGRAAEVANLSGARSDIRFSQPAIAAMEALPESQVPAVAEAIKLIGEARPDKVLKITAPEMPSERYKVMIPHDHRAPIVMYRSLTQTEGGGYLVAALVPGETYEKYEGVDEVLGTPRGQQGLRIAQEAVLRERS